MPNKEAPPAPAQAAEKSEQQEKPPARRPASSTRNKPKDQTDTVSEAPSSSPAPEHVVSKVGPLGLGVVLDECNIVIDLVKGGQAEADGVLNVGDQLVGVDGEALKRRPLAKVLPPGKKQYTFAVRRNARKPSECILMETTTPNENAAAAAALLCGPLRRGGRFPKAVAYRALARRWYRRRPGVGLRHGFEIPAFACGIRDGRWFRLARRREKA